MCQNAWYAPAAGEFASTMATTVQTSSTNPLADSIRRNRASGRVSRRIGGTGRCGLVRDGGWAIYARGQGSGDRGQDTKCEP